VAGIVGFAKALELAPGRPRRPRVENARLTRLRDQLIAGTHCLPGVTLNGTPHRSTAEQRQLPGRRRRGRRPGAALDLEGHRASTGSACTTGSAEPSHVLLAMG
jgi:cysteine desulfurase